MDSVRRTSVAAVVIALTVAGCGGPESAPAPVEPNLDPPVHYTTEWTAPENIDLFDRASELVRVSVESGDYAMSFGVDGDYPDYPPFPGYAKAIGAPARGDVNFTDAYYATPFPQADLVERARYYHLAQLTTDGKSIDATVCGYRIGADESSKLALSPLKGAVHVRLSTTSVSPGLPGIADADAESSDPRAHVLPSWDVFGDWKIDTLINAGFDERDTFSGACFPWWSEKFPTFTPKYNLPYLFPPDDYVYPSMPEKHVQYPEWIGPGDPT